MALPGVTTLIKDRFFSQTRSDVPTGARVVALAPRNTATGTGGVQDYDPYMPRSEEDIITAFGEGSGAHRAFIELIAGGVSQPIIVALASGLSDTALYSANVFDKAFEAAETVRPDVIACWGRGSHPTDWEVPATPGNDLQIGFYADNTSGGSLTNNMAKKVADKCREISDRTHPVFGIIGVSPFIGTGSSAAESMTASSVSTHLGLANLTDREATGFGLNGEYVSVVATELIPQGYADAFGYANGACTYAGTIAQLPSYSATTFKPIFNVNKLRYNPTRTLQSALIDKGVIPVTLNTNRIAVWVDGTTFGKATSDYTRLSTLRIVFDTIQLCRQAVEPFVGEASTMSARNSLETAITSALRSMKQIGALLNAEFNVRYVPRENRAIIDLTVRPAFELRNIDVSISVQL